MQLGADPHQLEVLARSQRAAARQLHAIGVATTSRFTTLHWYGPAAARRLEELRVELGGSLRSVALALGDSARRLDAHALAQRAASVADHPAVLRWFDPVGDGRLVERWGPTGAGVVVVLVPGVGTDLADRHTLRARAVSVRATLAAVHERAGADPDDIAVVSWLGYDPPDRVLGGIDPRPAATGARRLADDVARLRDDGAARVVVVGHSYGAVVAARGAAEGMDVDDLVLLGSPGLGVDRIGAVRLRPGGSVWAAAAPGDLVSLVARAGLVHGPDPVPLARRLPTSTYGHGGYLDDPVLLAALAAVAGGRSRSISPVR